MSIEAEGDFTKIVVVVLTEENGLRIDVEKGSLEVHLVTEDSLKNPIRIQQGSTLTLMFD